LRETEEMPPPLVSVIMAVHNGEQFIREAIDSVLEQTFKDFEFIVIDDGSTDSTSLILAEYQSRDARIHVKRLDQNQGLTICLNMGIQLARGKYVARMDADDVCLPHRFEEQVKYLDKHPEIVVLGTAFTFIDEAGNHQRDYVFSDNPDVLKWNLLFFNPISHPTAMFRLPAIKSLDGYDPKIIRAQDYDLWWRVSLIGKLGNLKDAHLLLRLHEKRVTNKHKNQQLDSAKSTRKKYLSMILGRDIPESVIDNIKGKRTTAQSAAMASNVIVDYCHYCIEGVTNPGRVLIIGQALDKAAWKIGRFVLHPITWPVSIRILLLYIQFLAARIQVLFLLRSEMKPERIEEN
jgi:glycosyltransferase involved in cell wall biosynthesis